MKNRVSLFIAFVLVGLLSAPLWVGIQTFAKEKGKDKGKGGRFPGATSSQPLPLTADGESLLVVNPDNDSVTIFNVKKDKNREIDTVNVGREPNGVAVLPGGRTAYVANTLSGTVSVIDFT